MKMLFILLMLPWSGDILTLWYSAHKPPGCQPMVKWKSCRQTRSLTVCGGDVDITPIRSDSFCFREPTRRRPGHGSALTQWLLDRGVLLLSVSMNAPGSVAFGGNSDFHQTHRSGSVITAFAGLREAEGGDAITLNILHGAGVDDAPRSSRRDRGFDSDDID